MDELSKIAVSSPALAKLLSKVRHHFGRGLSSLSKEHARGLRRKTMRGSGGVPDSLAMMPLVSAAKAVKGKTPVHRAMWNKLHKPALDVDTAAGNVAHDLFKHVPGLRSLFLQKEMIPVTRHGDGARSILQKMRGKKMPREKLQKEVERPSIMAPLTKATELATPFALGIAAEKALGGLRKKEDANS